MRATGDGPAVRAVKAAAIAAAALLVGLAAPAHAQRAGKPAPATTGRTVALAPLTALGAEDTSASAKKIQAELEQAFATVEGTKVTGAKATLDAVKKAKRPELRVCEGDVACLAALGKLLGVDLVVAGEAGGLGDVQVVYLELVDVATGKSVRSTTLEVGDATEGGAVGAAYRLLAPSKYVGTMTLAIDTEGASIYVDGKRVGKSPAPPASLSVGTHALRVTHPEFRDYVRFVDVGFGADTRIDVALQQYPIVSSEIAGTGQPGGNVTYLDRPTPWYRKWWAIAGFSSVILISAGITAGVLADGVDADTVRPVQPED